MVFPWGMYNVHALSTVHLRWWWIQVMRTCGMSSRRSAEQVYLPWTIVRNWLQCSDVVDCIVHGIQERSLDVSYVKQLLLYSLHLSFSRILYLLSSIAALLFTLRWAEPNNIDFYVCPCTTALWHTHTFLLLFLKSMHIQLFDLCMGHKNRYIEWGGGAHTVHDTMMACTKINAAHDECRWSIPNTRGTSEKLIANRFCCFQP